MGTWKHMRFALIALGQTLLIGLAVHATTFQLQSGGVIPAAFTPDGNGITDNTAIDLQGLLAFEGSGSGRFDWKIEIRDSQNKQTWHVNRQTSYAGAGIFPERWSVVWNGTTTNNQSASVGTYTILLKIESGNTKLDFPLGTVRIYLPGRGNEVAATAVTGQPIALKLPSSQRLTVPADAVPPGTVVILRVPSDIHGRWNAVEVLPDGLMLASPASLIIPYAPAADIPAGCSENGGTGIWWNSDLAGWQLNPEATLDKSAKRVTLSLAHFSEYAAAAAPAVAPAIQSVYFSAQTGHLTINLDDTVTGAASYTLFYGPAAGPPYEGSKAGIPVSTVLDVAFFGYGGCPPGTVHFAVQSVSSDGTTALSADATNDASTPVTTVWPPVQTLASLNPVSGTTLFLTSDHVYHVTSSLSQTVGNTLLIEPGTVVKFEGHSIGLTINGNLKALGDACRPIVFTSWNDATVGGATGTGNPAAADWSSIDIHTVSNSSPQAFMDHCQVRFGGYNGALPDEVRVHLWGNSQVILTDSTFSYSFYNGLEIRAEGAAGLRYTVTADNLSFDHNGGTANGTTYSGCGLVLSAQNSSGIAAQAADGHVDFTSTNNTAYAIQIAGNVAAEIGPGTVTAAGNGYNAIKWNYGTLGMDLTWHNLGAPYLVMGGNNYVLDGVTLTLDPGVCIKFSGTYNTDLFIDGSLTAVGTQEQPIIFTSWNDATVGGTTGTGTPYAGDWDYIEIHRNSSSNARRVVMDHCQVKYGGANSAASDEVKVNLWGNNQVTLTDSTFSYSLYNGLEIRGRGAANLRYTVTVDNLSFDHNGGTANGTTYSGCGLVLSAQNSSGIAAQAADGHVDFTSTNNTAYAIQIAGNVAAEIGPGTVTAAGNGYNAIKWNYGTLGMDLTWHNLGAPYLVMGGNNYVQDGVTLTLDPGVCIKFSGTYNTDLFIDASLTAVGTQEQPIIFTSWNDATVGGATGTGVPLAGDWDYIEIHRNSSSNARRVVMDHCQVKYGGANGAASDEVKVNLWGNNTASISHSVISNSLTEGLRVISKVPTVAISLNGDTFANNGGMGLSLGASQGTYFIWAKARNCSFLANNNNGAGIQLGRAGGYGAICYVDAALCWWGYSDLEGHVVVPDGWRATPWYTADPGQADSLELVDWTGNFNPTPTSTQGLSYKDSFLLSLNAPMPKQWRVQVFPIGSQSAVYDVTNTNTGLNATWGQNAAVGEYYVMVTDASAQPSFPPIRADVWADTALYGVMPQPVSGAFYGLVPGTTFSHQGILTATPCGYTTNLWETKAQTQTAANLASFTSACVGTKDNPVLLSSRDIFSSPAGTFRLDWMGNVPGHPAQWIGFSANYSLANLLITVSPHEASGSPSSSGSVQVAVDASHFPGTLTTLEGFIVRRKYIQTNPGNLAAYCHEGIQTSSGYFLPDAATFALSDTELPPRRVSSDPSQGLSFAWNAANHGDGLYAAKVHVAGTLGNGQSFDTTFWNDYHIRPLAGWAGTWSIWPLMGLVPSDSTGPFRYDGQHLLSYTYPSNWIGYYDYLAGRPSAPIITSIVAGVLSSTEQDSFNQHDLMIQPLDGVGTGQRVWYWDGVLKDHRTISVAPYFNTQGLAGLGFIMGEVLRPDTAAISCHRQGLALDPYEFVLKDYGTLIDPVLNICSNDSPQEACAGSSSGSKINVTMTVNKTASLEVKLWRTGDIADSTVPSTPAVDVSVGPVNPGAYTWTHSGLINGYRLMEGLYEVEVIASATDGSDQPVVQKAAQTIKISW